jgi:hypothetical protein
MKLEQIQCRDGHCFDLTFENSQRWESDFQSLIGQHVALEDVSTDFIDAEWDCLEFLNGQIDVELKKLANYAGIFDTRSTA